MEPFVKHLSRYLFVGRELNIFAVLDGASIPNLPTSLQILQPEYACLYRGELEPDMAEVAPYLVRLETGSQFTEWVAVDGWGKHWGIFVRSTAELAAVRRHLRGLSIVHDDEDGRPLLFRYYDPRVLRVFLQTCNAEQLASFFGPLDSILVENESADTLLRFRLIKGTLKREKRTFTTEEQESLELARAEKERQRQELMASEEEDEGASEDDLQQSLVDFWMTMQKYKPPKKPSKE